MTHLINDDLPTERKREYREQFVAHAARSQIAQRMDELTGSSSDDVASWFVTDARGLQLASSIRNEDTKNSTVGQDFSRRAYFHGGENDFEQRQHYDLPPIETTRLSPVFQSDASGTWKVAISTPIMDGGRCLGIIALTVELGDLGHGEDFANSGSRFVTLVDGRSGAHRGQILHHPLFNEILAELREREPRETAKLPDFRDYVVPLDEVPARPKVERVSLVPRPAGEA